MFNNLSLFKQGLIIMIITWVMTSTNARADFHGSALHLIKQVARQDALTDLQQNIYVNIESSSFIYQTSGNDDVYEFSSSITSTIPLLGVQIECNKLSKEWKCDSQLKSSFSTPLYLAAITHQQKGIDARWELVNLSKAPPLKYIELKKLLLLNQERQKLILVFKMLNPNVKIAPSATVSSLQISNEIALLEETAKSLSMAASLLSKNITKKANILVKAFLPYYSQDITPFTSALQNELNDKLNTVNSKYDADFTLQGKYRINKTSLQVETQLVNKHGQVVNTEVISVEKSGLSQYPFEPKDSSFEQLLLTGQID
jgi:hypothetical protein